MNTLLHRTRFAGLAGLVLFAPDDGGGAGGGGGGNSGDQNSGSGGQNDQGGSSNSDKGASGDDQPKQVQMTQAELDALINKRIGAARASWEKEINNAAARAQETAEQKAQRERDEAIEAAKARDQRAENMLRQAQATIQAGILGVKPERINAALKLADLSGIEVKDDVADEKAARAAIEAVLKDYPEFKAGGTEQSAGSSAPGGSDNGGNGGPPSPPKTMQDAIAARFERERAAAQS